MIEGGECARVGSDAYTSSARGMPAASAMRRISASSASSLNAQMDTSSFSSRHAVHAATVARPCQEVARQTNCQRCDRPGARVAILLALYTA